MRSKPVQWLTVVALLFVCSVPGWAQPELVGKEFQVNQNKESRQLQPVAVFGPSGNALIVWETELGGILGRFYDRKGAITGELALVPNRNLPSIPGHGEVLVRKDPSVVMLPNGELVLFWTEEKDYLSVYYFYESRKMLEQDVFGQRFDATGKPIGGRFLVSATTDGFQRRPTATLGNGGIFVVWESSKDGKRSIAIQGRLLTRQGKPVSDELRIDAGNAPDAWSAAQWR